MSLHMYPDKDAPCEALFHQLQSILSSLHHHDLPDGCKYFTDWWTAAKGYPSAAVGDVTKEIRLQDVTSEAVLEVAPTGIEPVYHA